MKILNLIILMSAAYVQSVPEDKTDEIEDGATYDFIVVGAGTSGCVIAGRLVAKKLKVLLVEGGGDPPITSKVPTLISFNFMSDIDWQYKIEPSPKACLGMKGKQCTLHRGKVVGGTHAINGMLYVRGNSLVDFDNWEQEGWSQKEVFPYMLRTEGFTEYDTLPPELKPYHNPSGPLKLSPINKDNSTLNKVLFAAYQELGVPYNRDVNGPSQIGITNIYGSIFKGERFTTADAFLTPLEDSPKLILAKYAIVTQVLIHSNKTAYGVKVNLSDGRKISLKAKYEVILSAGSIKTPQLLMLSGIGPRDHLREIGIDTLIDLPVGENLQDHTITPMIFKVGRQHPTIDDISIIAIPLGAIEYLINRDGYFASLPTPADVVGFYDTLKSGPVPDIEWQHVLIPRASPVAVSIVTDEYLGYNDEIKDRLLELNTWHSLLVVLPTLLTPLSEGRVLLKDRNPDSDPLIYANYFQNVEDMNTTLRLIKFTRELETTDAFVEHKITLQNMNLKGCEQHKFGSDDYFYCYMSHMSSTNYHLHGTAGIGRVVDKELRLYGVDRLRVVDGSVFPTLLHGNTVVACLVVAEKAFDFLVEQYNL